MARYGISKQAVFTAADYLTSQGKEPTIEQIRLILKTGSNSTIAAHLREWRVAQSDEPALSLTTEMPDELVMMIKGLWERISSQAGSDAAGTVANYEQTIAELQQALQKYQGNNRRWQQLFLHWQQQKNQLMLEKVEMEQQIATLQSKLEIQSEQLQEKRIRIEELHRLHLQSQANVENKYEEMSRMLKLLVPAI